MKKLILSALMFSLTSSLTFAQSRFEKGIYKDFTEAQLAVDKELGTIFNEKSRGGANTQRFIGTAETVVSFLTIIATQGEITKLKRAAQTGKIKYYRGVQALAGYTLFQGVTRMYIVESIQKSPGILPLLSIGIQQFQKLTDSEKAELIYQTKERFDKCMQKSYSEYYYDCDDELKLNLP